MQLHTVISLGFFGGCLLPRLVLSALVKQGFTAQSHGSYQRVPKGYDPEHERAEHLKRKGLTVNFPPLPKGILASKSSCLGSLATPKPPLHSSSGSCLRLCEQCVSRLVSFVMTAREAK